MKKSITRTLAALLLCAVLAQGCVPTPSPAPIDGVKETPVRVGSGGMHVTPVPYTLVEAIETADLVADITVASWMGERTEESGTTFFIAETNEVFKGEPIEEFILLQMGTSERMVNEFPLFKVGSRMVLCLESVDDSDYEKPSWMPKNAYTILGVYLLVLHVEEVDDTLYIIDRFGPLTHYLCNPESPDFDPNRNMTILSNAHAKSIISVRNARDPVMISELGRSENVFYYDEITQYITNIIL